MTKILPYIKYPLAGLALTGALLYPAKSNAQLEITTTVVKSDGTSQTTTYYPTKSNTTTTKTTLKTKEPAKNNTYNLTEDIFIKSNTNDAVLGSSRNYTKPSILAAKINKSAENVVSFEIPSKPEVVKINTKIDNNYDITSAKQTSVKENDIIEEDEPLIAEEPESSEFTVANENPKAEENPAAAENLESESYAVGNTVTPKGTTNPEILSKAPSPNVTINGKLKKAKIVVDLSENILYHYDNDGNTLKAYKIASGRRTGKKPTPTHTGVRSVSHIEYYNYKTAPSTTKRFKNPDDYGPMIIILNKVDPKTGQTSQIGEFIHGNKDKKTLGLYVSGGCMRMDNEVIQYLAPLMKRGDIVLIKANKKQQF